MPDIRFRNGAADTNYGDPEKKFGRAVWHQTTQDTAQLGHQTGLASSIANQYGQQAGQMQNKVVGNEFSSPDQQAEAAARAQQMAALDYQRRLSMGQAQSVPEQQYRQGLYDSAAGQTSLARSAAGNPSAQAAAMRQAAFSNSANAMAGNNQAQQIRAREMASARERYANGMNDLRGQDQGMWEAMQNRELAQEQLRDRGVLASQGMANNILGGQMEADQSAWDAQVAGTEQTKEASASRRAAGMQVAQQVGFTALSGAMAMSDIRVKSDVLPAGAPMRSASSNADMRNIMNFSQDKPLATAGGPLGPSGNTSVSEGTKLTGARPVASLAPSPYSRPLPQGQAVAIPPAGMFMQRQQAVPVGLTGSMMSDENVKTDVKYTSQDYYGKAKHNDSYRNAKVKGDTSTHIMNPSTRAVVASRAAMNDEPLLFSDAHIKEQVHAAGYDAGVKAGLSTAMQRLGTGNGTTAQRSTDIDAELSRIGRQSPRGQIAPGNIDLYHRPVVRNPDGSISTVRSMGVNVDGREVLIPTVSPDGRVMSNDEAIDMYRTTGQHLGQFDSVGASNEYAKDLHLQQEGLYETPERLSRLGSGNGSAADRNADIDAEIARMSAVGQRERPPASRDASPVTRDAPSLEPIESLHQAPYSNYYEDADKNLGYTKERNYPDDDRLVMSDANVKTVDAKPVYKEQYADSRAKMKNENHSSRPSKDPAKFPMQKQALGSVMSDERAKDVRPGGETSADKFLETLSPYEFRYRNAEMAPTSYPTNERFLGVMAQNLEKGPTGSTIVTNTPKGKALEGGSLLSALSAGTGRLAERVNQLESMLAKSKKSR